MPRSKEGFLWTPSCTKTGLETDSVLPSTPASKLRDTYDVIVIGAGFAGLIAARDLSKQPGLDVLLVEGRDRIGGRTWTAKELGEEFEMGGTWVHWNQPHVYAELSRYALHARLKTSAGTLAAERNAFAPPSGPVRSVLPADVAAAAQRVADVFFAVDGRASRDWMPFPHDPLRAPAPWRALDRLTVADRLAHAQLRDVPQADKDVFDALVGSFGSAPGTETGFVEALRWYALGGHSMAGVFELAGVYKLGGGGMTAFAREVLGEFRGDVVFGTVVKGLDQDERGVAVVVEGGKVVRAGQVVCTVPLNCLGDVTFDPPLSSLKQEAIRHGHMNQGAKIHMRLRKTEPGWFAMASASGDSPWCFSFSDHNGTGSKSGDGTYAIAFGYNDRIPDPTKPESSEQIIQSFAQYLRPRDLPRTEVTAYLTHPWHLDSLAKGVWSCWGPNAMSRFLAELQQPHGRVLFASADWADGWRGFIDGAIERGLRAAREVLETRKAEAAKGTKKSARL